MAGFVLNASPLLGVTTSEEEEEEEEEEEGDR